MKEIVLTVEGWDDRDAIEGVLSSDDSGFEIPVSPQRTTRHSALGTAATVIGYVIDLHKLSKSLAKLFAIGNKETDADIVITLKLPNGAVVTVTVDNADGIALQLERILS